MVPVPKKGEKVICIMSDCHQWGYIIGSAYTLPVEAHRLPEPPEGRELDDTTRVLELKDDSSICVRIGDTTMVIDKDKAEISIGETKAFVKNNEVAINGTDISFKGNVAIDGTLWQILLNPDSIPAESGHQS